MILQTETFQGNTYRLVASDTGERITWQDAEAFAVTLGGHLVTVDSAAENTFLLGAFGPTAVAAAPAGGGLVSLWLGLNDAASEGSFVWASGAPVTYSNWLPGEPAGNFLDEDFAGMLVGGSFFVGQWHDIVSDFRLNDVTFGVVEVVPEPSSVVLLCGGAFGLFGYSQSRRRLNLKSEAALKQIRALSGSQSVANNVRNRHLLADIPES